MSLSGTLCSPTPAALLRCVWDSWAALGLSGRNIKLTFDSASHSAASSRTPFPRPRGTHTPCPGVSNRPQHCCLVTSLWSWVFQSFFFFFFLYSRLPESVPHKEQTFLSVLDSKHVSPLLNCRVASRNSRGVGVRDSKDLMLRVLWLSDVSPCGRNPPGHVTECRRWRDPWRTCLWASGHKRMIGKDCQSVFSMGGFLRILKQTHRT